MGLLGKFYNRDMDKEYQIPLFPPPCFLPGMQTQGSPAAKLDHEVTWKIDSSAEEETNREKETGTLMTWWSHQTTPGLPASRYGAVKDTTNLFKPLCLSLCSVQFSRSVVSNSLRPHESQHARPPCLSPAPGVYSNSCPLSW